jgi:sulfotransferase family protein
MARPNLFIVGAPKAGTTSLYDYLAGHPQIYMSPFKEPMYFCPDVHAFRDRNPFVYGEDEAAYLALFDDAREEKRLGEATTRYLVSHEAAGLVREFAPDALAIAMLRNPVDLVHALHNERVSQGNEPITDFEQALAADARRARGEDLPGAMNALGSVYRESANFAEPLRRWFEALGRERVLVVVFDDFTRDPAAELRRVLEFCSVATDYQPASFSARNPSHRQRQVVRQLVDSRLGSFITDDVARALLGSNARARLALRFRHSRLNRRAVRREPMPVALRARLEAEFQADVEATGALIGRDLGALWFQPQTERPQE